MENSVTVDDEIEVIIPMIELDSASEVEIGAEGGSQSITFTTNTDWSVELSDTKAASDWISISPMSGEAGLVSLTIAIEGNPTIDSRSAYVKIIADTVSDVIAINQAEGDVTLSIESPERNVGKEAGEFDLSITSNNRWNIEESSEWLTFSKSEGSGDDSVVVSYQANESVEPRQAEVIISSDDKMVTLVIIQAAGDPYITLSSTSQSVDAAAGEVSIEIKSNVSWSVSGASEWLTLSKSESSGDDSLIISYLANESVEVRESTLTFTAEQEIVTFTIIQAAGEPYFIMDVVSEDVSSAAGELEINIETNTDWTISGVPTWITLSPTSGSGNQTLSLSYTANSLTTDRVATITISSDYLEQELTITQAAFVPILTLSKSEESLTSAAGSFTVDLAANTDWTISGVTTWITLSPTSGSGNQTLSLSYTANSLTTDRVATITISSDYLEQELTITQAAFVPILTLSKSEERVSVDAGSLTFSVTSNTYWSVSNLPSWVTISTENGTGNKSITLTYTRNTTTERTATILFKAYDIVRTFELTQSAPQLGDLEDGGSL
ncbi:MAG: BACON domain-containing protein [Rikenellaceae bacterium]